MKPARVTHVLFEYQYPIMFNKKQPLIPLEELVSALRLCRMLREENDKLTKDNLYYSYSILFHTDERFSERLIEGKIEKHGYKKIGEEFYLLSDLKKIPSTQEKDYTKDGETLYQNQILSALVPLKI